MGCGLAVLADIVVVLFSQWRAGLRAENMRKHDMSTAYNPITGEVLPGVAVPDRPSSPSYAH